MNGLALQGGGCLGYGQVLVLTEAEVRWNAATSSVFDIIGGTSVGSIVGACLASEIPAGKIVQFFTHQAPIIFKSSVWNKISLAWGPKYSGAALELALQQTLGTKTLADCKTKFIATSYDWLTDRPVYFKSFEQSSQSDDFIIIGPDSGIQLWQICRASSAAQTYFPGYEYNGMVLMDGGNIGDNNPDMLILSEMLKLTQLNQIKILSLGSGNSKWNQSNISMTSPCPLKAGIETITIVFAAGADSQSYKAGYILNDKYFRLSPDLGSGIAIDNAQGCITKIPVAVNKLLEQPNTLTAINSFNKQSTKQIYVNKHPIQTRKTPA